MKYMPKPGKLPWQDQRGITGLETAIVLIAFVVVSSVFAFAALSTGLFSADKSKETINAGLSEARGTLEVRGSILAKSLVVSGESLASDPATTGDLNSTPVLDKSETLTHSVFGTMKKVSSPSTGDEYSLNYTTGLVTFGTALTGSATVTADYTAQIVDEITLQLANAAGGEAVDLTPGETIITYTDADQFLNVATADITVTALGNADSDKLVEPGEMYEIKLTSLVSRLNPDLKKGYTLYCGNQTTPGGRHPD